MRKRMTKRQYESIDWDAVEKTLKDFLSTTIQGAVSRMKEAAPQFRFNIISQGVSGHTCIQIEVAARASAFPNRTLQSSHDPIVNMRTDEKVKVGKLMAPITDAAQDAGIKIFLRPRDHMLLYEMRVADYKPYMAGAGANTQPAREA